jgi:hypothetical protein
MNKTQLNKQITTQCAALAQDLIKIGLHTQDASILTLGNTMDTILSVGSDPRGLADLNQVLSDFCVRQIKREQGMTDAELAVDELLSMKCNMN